MLKMFLKLCLQYHNGQEPLLVASSMNPTPSCKIQIKIIREYCESVSYG